MENKILAVACLSIALMSCMVGVKEQPPAISDISNADSLVRVQSSWFPKHGQIAFPSLVKVQQEGDRGCSQFGKPAVLLSGRCVERSEAGICWTREYLFACRTPEGEEVAKQKEDKRSLSTSTTKQVEQRASTQPVVVETNQNETDEYRQCLREISGRLPEEFCDRRRGNSEY